MGWKKWLPAYLWYSGILMQTILVILGIHALIAAADRRPAHKLHKEIFERLSEQDFCNRTLSGLSFNWKDFTEFKADVASSKAQIEKLEYTNRGSVGRTNEGSHVYRLVMRATVKDLRTGELIQFPPRYERLVEVDSRDRIVGCTLEENKNTLKSDKLQNIRTQACERPGWERRELCDEGTERCYPMTLCEQGSS